MAYAVTGLLFFVAPTWASERFPWSVTPFVAMTIGGWCLGNAMMSGLAVRWWRWAEVRAILLYLWSFAALQIGVVLWFLDKLVLDTVLTYPYLAALGIGLAGGVAGVIELARRRPSTDAGGTQPGILRLAVIAFVVVVGFLTAIAIFRPGSGRTLNIFPQELSPFTVRAFGAFYLALIVGAVPLLWTRTTASVAGYAAAGEWLIVFILLPVIFFWGVFDLENHATQLIYPGTYVAVGVLAALVVWRARRAVRSVT